MLNHPSGCVFEMSEKPICILVLDFIRVKAIFAAFECFELSAD